MNEYLMKPIWKILLLSFFLFYLLSIPCLAGTALILDSDKQFDFAQHCFTNQEFLRAADEFKRFVYFFPDDDRVEQALFNIGLSYYKGSLFEDAIHSFNVVNEKYEDTELSIQSYFLISKCYVHLEKPTHAIISLKNLIAITDNMQIKDEACYRIGWIYIETGSWEKARDHFQKISMENMGKYRIGSIYSEMDAIEFGDDGLIHEKNPELAAILSIIPGTGQLYCGRYRDALVAFLLNAGLILAAYESFDKELYALGGVITVVEFGFYAGNIYGARSSAHKYNRVKTRNFIDKLIRNTKVDFSAQNLGRRMNNHGVVLSLKYAF